MRPAILTNRRSRTNVLYVKIYQGMIGFLKFLFIVPLRLLSLYLSLKLNNQTIPLRDEPGNQKLLQDNDLD